MYLVLIIVGHELVQVVGTNAPKGKMYNLWSCGLLNDNGHLDSQLVVILLLTIASYPFIVKRLGVDHKIRIRIVIVIVIHILWLIVPSGTTNLLYSKLNLYLYFPEYGPL